MTDTQRHNIRVLLPRMRGKTKEERMQAYEAIRVGPLLWPLYVAIKMAAANQSNGSPT